MGIFQRDQQVFANADPLDDSYEPDDIRERDEVLEKYKRALQPIIDNRPTSNIFLYGKTGTGKTVATKFLLSHLEVDVAEYDDVNLSTVWVGCENLSTSYQVAVALVNELRQQQEEERISTTGYSQQRVFELLYEELDALGGTVVIVLDEIDNIGRSDDILYGLPRAQSNGYVEDVRPVVIGISNDFQFRDSLSPKVKDTLAEKEILFPPYDANQLRSILKPRAEKAFYEGVLEDDVVPLSAAFAAQDTGSARQAIRLLREAGELAQAANAEAVTGDHVRDAQNELEKNQLYEGMQELTTQGHAVLCALASHQADNEVPVRSRQLYNRYVSLCDRLDADSVSERRIRDHLSDMNMLGLITVYERNEGLSAGRYHEYELDVPLKSVLDILTSTTRFKEVANSIQTTADKNDYL
ncbi:orc1/cdc6 family replication initiation protein [Haloterrigena alkaliphila]|uniref:orc1/cdc6 family replication initiation protein n=1 Tax=Haloterrigena alkaliphila TaxID=2816475 RepID=UPI001CFFDB63|nr:orc1/cdc6 family replication initiation protein [Haloterrigena alkaliphila]UHQ95295.1 orc1/cdc6 family replication initiation protein [Haloterrigena alkaliphila]